MANIYALSACKCCYANFYTHLIFVRPRSTPRSTPFPYTTLFLSWSKQGREHAQGVGCHGQRSFSNALVRSEEHTSELQSHVKLVCRLLLEKKKHRLTISASATSARGTRRRTRRSMSPGSTLRTAP